MNEIGGYFELELGRHRHYHEKAVKINTARNCIKYLIRSQNIKKMYIPAYCCNGIIQAIEEENIDFTFYHLDYNYEITDLELNEKDYKLLYINYYGIKSKYCQDLAKHHNNKLIIDNSQSFFTPPLPDIDTIYNARKFFGVPDGAYLYTNKKEKLSLAIDSSIDMFDHLLGRIEDNAQSHYQDFLKSESKISKKQLKIMSKITDRLLCSLDYNAIKKRRESNFKILKAELSKENALSEQPIKFDNLFAYLFKSNNPKIKDKLIENKIYVATYWQEALKNCNAVERDLIQQTVALPIDQRYNEKHMYHIAKVVKNASK